ncbi:MAG: hypothetical protein ACLPYS_10845 [Vulcanimicrobiaceae bacterium]
MNLIPGDLAAAAAAARDRLNGFAAVTATANTSPGNADGTLGSMASAAREAIFADALLGALRARLEELKGVAK